MDYSRNFVRACTIPLLLLLSVYFVQHPIFERFEISEHEGDTIPIYFTKITGKSEGGYIVEVGFSRTPTKVMTDANLKTGEVVSFYGPVKNTRLIAQKYRRHKYPNTIYHLSGIGLIGFLWLMKREGN